MPRRGTPPDTMPPNPAGRVGPLLAPQPVAFYRTTLLLTLLLNHQCSVRPPRDAPLTRPHSPYRAPRYASAAPPVRMADAAGRPST